MTLKMLFVGFLWVVTIFLIANDMITFLKTKFFKRKAR